MKKFFCFLTVALLATLSLSVTSCSDDDKYGPATEESILGLWASDWDCDNEDEDVKYYTREVWTFSANSSFSCVYQTQLDGEVIHSGNPHSGVWTLKGGLLAINHGGHNIDVYECYISGNTLKLVEVDENEDEENYVIYLKRM